MSRESSLVTIGGFRVVGPGDVVRAMGTGVGCEFSSGQGKSVVWHHPHELQQKNILDIL